MLLTALVILSDIVVFAIYFLNINFNNNKFKLLLLTNLKSIFRRIPVCLRVRLNKIYVEIIAWLGRFASHHFI